VIKHCLPKSVEVGKRRSAAVCARQRTASNSSERVQLATTLAPRTTSAWPCSASRRESLPAYSASTGHFYPRSDPGTTLATLALDGGRLSVVREVTVPAKRHCLIADEMGHYWTCNPNAGRTLRFDDP
jgi:hypothetical protein